MNLLNIEGYPNLLDVVNLTSPEVETQIIDFSLSFPHTRDKRVEWGMKFPMFLYSFYRFIRTNNTVPDQESFWHFYLTDNSDFFDERGFDKTITEALRARAFRTYPSLVRDIHFSLLVNEKANHTEVLYNQDIDVKKGIDLLLKFYDNYYAINLYTGTKRAYTGRAKKESRHVKYANIRYVEFPVKFSDNNKHGQFFLYGETEFQTLKDKLKHIHHWSK